MNIKTNNMSYKIVESREIVWSEENDRYILIIREENEVVGLNYMQGDELDLFKRDFSDIDHPLTDFYNAIKYHLTGETELDRVNQAIWAHFDYKNRKHERKHGFMRS
jgi:hypothetical protein